MADKKSKKDRQKELRQLDRQLQGGGSGVDYSKVSDRHVDDKRFEREMEHKISLEKSPYGIVKEAGDTVRDLLSAKQIMLVVHALLHSACGLLCTSLPTRAFAL
jgi:hypothetical protein